MATKATARKRTPAPPPPRYLEKVMFHADDVEGRRFEKDNMDHLSPACINTVDDDEIYAVYQFIGLQRVKTSIVFEEVKA